MTQRLNVLAFGSLLPRIREYKPDSLITIASRFWPDRTKRSVSLSSPSTWSRIALGVLLYPKISATSFPTNQGSPSLTIVLTVPNSLFVNVLIPSIFFVLSVLNLHCCLKFPACKHKKYSHLFKDNTWQRQKYVIEYSYTITICQFAFVWLFLDIVYCPSCKMWQYTIFFILDVHVRLHTFLKNPQPIFGL